MKSSMHIIFTILCLDFVAFSNDIPIESIVRKPEIHDVTLSMDGKYAAAIYTDTNDIQQLLTYNIETNKNANRFEYNNYIYDYYASYLGGGDNKKYLDSISPIHKVKNIKVPVFIAGGDEDRRVSRLQSYELADKLKYAGIHVETFIKAEEGHGFSRQKNITEYYRRVLDFFSRNLGKGRLQD